MRLISCSIILLSLVFLLVTGCSNSTSQTQAAHTTTQSSSLASQQQSVPESASSASESSHIVESSSQSSVASQSDVPAPSQVVAKPAKANPFAIELSENSDFYLWYSKMFTYEKLDDSTDNHRLSQVLDTINSLPQLQVVEHQPEVPIDAGFLLISGDNYKKTQFVLKKNLLQVDDVSYGITQQQYDQIYSAAWEGKQSELTFAQWLIYMNPTRVVGVSYTNLDEEPVEKAGQLVGSECACDLRNLRVMDSSTYKPGSVDFAKLKDSFKTELTFDNGVTYTVVLAGDKMYLESSDMPFACKYTVDETQAKAFIKKMTSPTIQQTVNPATGKPVIYLYPEKTMDISLKLNFKGQLTYTYPTYNNGWNVTAAKGGTLVNKADGTLHYYLFWEGNANFKDWDFSTGFVVKGSETEDFLKAKLPFLGLNAREYNDFITYWVPELARNEYNLINFATTQYDKIAPLKVTPAPDTVIRVHMVWKKIDEPVQIPPQIFPQTPERNGFTLVEWGGTRA